MTKYTLREAALELLTRIGEQGGFSHVLLDREISKQKLSRQDGALLTEIVYGTLQRRDLIDFYIQPYIAKQKKIKPWVRWLLYMSVYQMTFLERVPDHAIIHEAVEISKKRGHKGISSFINGVLRNVQRKGVQSLEKIEDPVERLIIETSHPKWLVDRWVKQYGVDTTKAMCEANNHHLPLSLRVQPLRITRKDAMNQLRKDGFKVEESVLSPQGFIVLEGAVLAHPLFHEGYLTVQDQSSMLVAEMMDLQEKMKVLDACSAPGGKTTHMAEKMSDRGEVIAYDLHEKKAKLVSKKAEQLQLTSITANQADSRELSEKHPTGSFDRILLDAPCSGLGVLRGKPDIKYHKKEEDIFTLRKIQDELLNEVAPLLKSNGKLVYSTCTVDQHENEEAVQHFLNKHPDFEVDETFFKELPEPLQNGTGISDKGLQLFPHEWDTDGFFLTRFIKK
ncbi:16S rRNA (cytosine(967)-C(5))-methyltransferase RsmB [Halobacillus karajensis]|uniref:16S rRNA (cytosine(967)-C(5))-methyltransferase n=1 Tax=Halobacillus karajensis TaxID=195088 RepID=A0A024P2V6_9BACI|nr:16S rRNA (cytosine(967)-C(5))-methyltransferase RsmB [Halobacillus karajensis]CDQ19801.1 Ribosomal RNA small subunit methyltransferase B [Halobacillus karajensis]CDQ22261.1 Ribosomal RNA small subunit methyltransferase B [Halobacillus karajensis]CDQ28102.1 Ribosomal RNA small subunit methyltransferase B [Halobacillus karajensis]